MRKGFALKNYEGRDKLPILVAVLISFNWLPPLISDYKENSANIFTLFAIFIIFLFYYERKLNIYLSKKIANKFFVSSFFILFGMSMGVFLNEIPLRHLITFIPNLIVCFFFMNIREGNLRKKIIIVLVISSWIACVYVLLAGFKILPSVATVSFVKSGEMYERIWGSIKSSVLGQYVCVLVSSLVIMIRIPTLMPLVYLGTILISVYVAEATAQRSILVSIVLILGMIISKYLILDRKFITKPRLLNNQKNSFFVALFLALILIIMFNIQFPELTRTLKYRIAAIKETNDMYGVRTRAEMWPIFINDLVYRPSIYAPGDDNIYEKLGTGPHFLLGESYYYSGIFGLTGLVLILTLAIKNIIRKIHFKKDSLDNYNLNWFIFICFISLLAYLSVMPGFFARIFYIIVGLAISEDNKVEHI